MDVRNFDNPPENPISHELASPELLLFCATVLWVKRSTITKKENRKSGRKWF